MNLLKDTLNNNGIGGHSGDELKHEGVMDMFKSTKVQTTPRDMYWLAFHSDLEFIQKGMYYLTEEDEEIPVHLDDIQELIKFNNEYLKNKNTKVIIIDKNYDGKFNKADDISKWYKNWNEDIIKAISEGMSKYFKYYYDSIEDGLKTYKKDDIKKALNNLKSSLKQVESNINSHSKVVSKDSELTKESAINQDWLATKNEIQLLSESASTFTTESASNFISNIKSFFSNSLLGINNAISNFMKTYTITDKYFKDNVNMLNSKSSVINTIISKKFFEIENIETKCVVGMKLNYLGTTKELKIFASKIPEIKTSIDGVSNFIENLYNNHNDARLSNIKNLDNLTELSSKTTEIISELIDGKSIKENVTIGNLFPNSNGIKIVKDELIEVNNILYKADVEALNKSVNRLISVVTIFLKEINENEATYSKGVINSLQYSVKETADIITNFGTFLVLSNQFTSYYLTTIDVIKDNAK